ncbi:hypothetical protein FE840_006230 [Peteryoungia desertarenae]|uniref:Autotransporter domain-containing protein n=1 Tax=Peteryoungia desertarenae TaxID=1813451 RepID=A0ABX6QKU3_9HYPH|nr:Ig-like domain-containing protein [Peteryoungia desertarenae]QLF69168.1 hypothetical protein FE840_006230 [Peteryoungia desertarenae]
MVVIVILVVFLHGSLTRHAYAEAAGGTETQIVVGGITYRVHTFTANGTLTVTSNISDVEYLIVGGGGGGDGGHLNAGWGSAGGGGEVVSGVFAGIAPGGYAVTVGSGGSAGGSYDDLGMPDLNGGLPGGDGEDSTFNGIVGRGGQGSSIYPAAPGSGGNSGNGNSGAGAMLGFPGTGGGGGGAGGSASGMNGGPGVASSIRNGVPTFYGGGGSARNVSVRGTTANGATADNTNGANGRGAGAGGGRAEAAYSGGSGIVVVRYAINRQATANAGPDQSIGSAASVMLDGTGSTDPNPGQTLTYQWTQTGGTAVTLSSTTSAQPTFTAPTLAVGDPASVLTFSLVVTDNLGLASTPDTVVVTTTSPGAADGTRIKITVSHSAAEALPADNTTEAEITVTLFDANGNILSAGGNLVVSSTNLGTLRQNPEGQSIPMRDNRNGTYSVWLRSSRQGIATITISVDGTVSGSTQVIFADTAMNIIRVTEEGIAGFITSRASRMAASQPGLIRFLDERGCQYMNAAADDDGGYADGCATHNGAWTEISAAWGNGDRYAQASIGIHRKLTENLIFGTMLQLDEMLDSTHRAEGTGWMVGPYFAARMHDQPLFFEGRVLFGHSNNTINPLGSYTDAFATKRWLGQFKMQGELHLDGYKLRPQLDLMHIEDKSDEYVDRIGNRVSSQSVGLTRLQAGLDVQVPLPVEAGQMNLTGGAFAIYSTSQHSGSDTEATAVRMHLGLDWTIDRAFSMQVGAFHEGIGAQKQSFGAILRLNRIF